MNVLDRLLCALCPLPQRIELKEGRSPLYLRAARLVRLARVTPNNDDYSYLIISLEDFEK